MNEKLRVARRILAGAEDRDSLSFEEFGKPDDAGLRRTAEDILREADADSERRIKALEEQGKKMKDALAFLLLEEVYP